MRLEDITFTGDGTTLLCDVSTGRARPLVPTSWRRQIFETIHNLAHPSIRATRKLVAHKFVWKGMQREVGIWAKQCVACQTAKIHKHVRAPLQQFDVPHRRFDHIHVDLVGPLPPSQGFTHLMTVVDRFSRWPEALPLTDTSAPSCAQALIFHWIARFGVPLDITSDRGSQFTSHLWTSVAQLLGTRSHHTTAYHPQSNGLVERFHRHLKSALRARLTGSNWIRELPWVLLGIRTVPKEDLGCSSAELVYGTPLTIPGDFIQPCNTQSLDASHFLQRLHAHVRSLVPTATSQHRVVPFSVPRNLQQAKFVFIRRDAHRTPLQRPYEGPFKVVCPGSKTFKVDIGGRTETISIDRIKPAYTDPGQSVDTYVPPRRGRPPKLSAQTAASQEPALPIVRSTTSRFTCSGRRIRSPQRFISVLGGAV